MDILKENKEEAQKFLLKFDKNNDGVLSFDEFLDIINQ